MDIITATESTCRNLSEKKSYKLRSKVVNLVSRPRKVKSNISVEERKALRNLRKADNICILSADKGRLYVVLDTAGYQKKCEALLKKLGKRDPTSRFKKDLVSMQTIGYEGAVNRVEYRKPISYC